MHIKVKNEMRLRRRSFLTSRNDGLALIGDEGLNGVKGYAEVGAEFFDGDNLVFFFVE